MAPLATAVTVFACVFAGALLGMLLQGKLPREHLDDRTKDVIRLAMGLIATMTALVLGLVTATAKSSFDTQDDAIRHSAAKILLLDRMLASYGPETRDARALLRATLQERVAAVWPEDRTQRPTMDAPEAALAANMIEERILRLAPQNDGQRWLQSHALEVSRDIAEARWLILGKQAASVPFPFLVVIVFWLAIIFASFGLFAPRNGTALATLLLCALSVGGAVFLILELDQPYEGLIKVSSAPLRYVIAHLAQ